MIDKTKALSRLKRVVPNLLYSTLRRGFRDSYAYHSYLHTRRELPYLLNARGLTGRGAEIGVKKGNYSRLILERWKGEKLYSIDPWMKFEEEEYRDVANVSQRKHESFYEETIEKLGPFGDRSKVLRLTSEEAALRFDAGELDFVYLDAQHHYEAVQKDIRLWWPKIRTEGILAGDDYLDGTNRYGEFGVKSAVDEFVDNRELHLHTTGKGRVGRNWFVYKCEKEITS